MDAQERLRQLIAQEERRLQAGVARDREGAILALLRARDRLPGRRGVEPAPDLVTGRAVGDLGGNKALRLCLEATDAVRAGVASDGEGLEGWGERFLAACGRLAAAELVLGHVETGFMRLVDDGRGGFAAWVATRLAPTGWRERADIAWWSGWLAERHAPELRALQEGRLSGGMGQDGAAGRLAKVYLAMMEYQLGLPGEAVIGGCTVQTYRDVLGWMIGAAVQAREHGVAPGPRTEGALIAEIAAALGVERAEVGRAVAGFTLDRENAPYHAAVPGVAAAPLVRVGPDRLVWSVFGLTTEPLFFLGRELRRREAEGYHNSAYLREGVFRRDLYRLFGDKRFVTSAGGVELRRAGGDVRTDVDALVFDKKTGTLGLFELKTQEPFARSSAELARQRENVLYANRQLSGVLDWLKRSGGDALLGRVDAGAAKRFRVQKVLPFVLGRYLVHFGDGAKPDPRAAWGTWPQVLRLVGGRPYRAGEGQPLASLFARLTKDEPLAGPPPDAPPREIVVGGVRLVVYPTYGAMRAASGGGG